MNGRDSCTVACVTPPGRGAVATIVINGPGALELVTPFFQSTGSVPFAERPKGSIVYGRWATTASTTAEDVVGCCFSNEEIEIHCHGGTAAVRAIAGSLVESGCREIAWKEYARTRHADPIAADALSLLAEARTKQTAAVLLDQYNGALRDAISAIHTMITSGEKKAAVASIDAILEYSTAAKHLAQPWRVVFTGPPNVGKSCLVNALAGFQRAIVHDAPGTTRDVLHVTVAMGGWLIELTDTAGITATTDPIEAIGIQKANLLRAGADVVVHVCDASTGAVPLPPEPASTRERLIRVANKCDLATADLLTTGPDANVVLKTSAITGEGVAELAEAIVARCAHLPPRGSAVPFNRRWQILLEAIRDALVGSKAEKALDLLSDALPGISDMPRG